ncbi:hypothetical protein WJX74_006993 [Apatococcus lobatus]|uniref:Uncharacterized protein n=1 Tax=Apatococcus lobatus TaxID=904363 RepID=A0AAW1SE94_9CHLO
MAAPQKSFKTDGRSSSPFALRASACQSPHNLPDIDDSAHSAPTSPNTTINHTTSPESQLSSPSAAADETDSLRKELSSAQQLAHHDYQSRVLSDERDRLLELTLAAADNNVMSAGEGEPCKEWAGELAEHFLQNLEESQRQMGSTSWEFLASPALQLDMADAVRAGLDMEQCQPGSPEHADKGRLVASLMKKTIRRKLLAVHDDKAALLRHQSSLPDKRHLLL